MQFYVHLLSNLKCVHAYYIVQLKNKAVSDLEGFRQHCAVTSFSSIQFVQLLLHRLQLYS